MNWLQKICAKDQSIVFFFINNELVTMETGYHEVLLEKVFSVPKSISYVVKFAFPRGRVARFSDYDSTYVEISKELNDTGHRHQISRLLSPVDRPLWGIEEHYFIWSEEQIAEKIKELIYKQLVTVKEINNCSFLHEYLPKIIEAVNLQNKKPIFAQKIKLAERTLYHGTCTFNESEIRLFGLIPSAGQFVQEMYGQDYEELPEINFAADKEKLEVCLSAMERCIAFHLKKDAYQVTENDIRNYGLLAIFSGSPGSAKPEDTGWQHRNEGDNYFDLDQYPTVEPGDYFSEGLEKPNILLKGSALIRFLKKNRILESNQDARKTLINLAKTFHHNISIQQIIEKINSLPDVEINKYISFYKKELQKQ